MSYQFPERVLITSGHEVGGLKTFAQGLAEGFMAMNIPTELIRPSKIWTRRRDLRDPRILKVLSTTAVFASPFARRAICVMHGTPSAEHQGWWKLGALVTMFKLASICSGVQMVAVSDYVAVHMQTIFNISTDAVIHNPVKSIFFELVSHPAIERPYITYVGRLNRAKNMHRLIPVIVSLVNETPGLRVCIVGEGELRSELKSIVKGDPRYEFPGNLDSAGVRDQLRRSKVFISGNPTEPFGIVFLEALSQGCIVAMPACGGGVEIALNQIGKRVHLLPLSFDHNQTLEVLRAALNSDSCPISMGAFNVKSVASSYLNVDARFDAQGIFHRTI